MSDPRPLWAKAPRSLIDRRWKQAHILVYLYLDLRAGRRGWWRTTQDVIADDLGFGMRAVEKAVAELRGGGLITTERHGNIGGQITYRLIARVPHESAVPLTAVPHSGAGGSARERGTGQPLSSFSDPQISTTEESPRSRQARERKQITDAYERVVRRA